MNTDQYLALIALIGAIIQFYLLISNRRIKNNLERCRKILLKTQINLNRFIGRTLGNQIAKIDDRIRVVHYLRQYNTKGSVGTIIDTHYNLNTNNDAVMYDIMLDSPIEGKVKFTCNRQDFEIITLKEITDRLSLLEQCKTKKALKTADKRG